MRKFLAALIVLIAGVAGVNGADVAVIASRADRAYDAGEWASAFALYSSLFESRPDSVRPYCRAVIASEMRADTAMTVHVIERALATGMPLDSLLAGIEADAFAMGRADLYGSMLDIAADSLAYIRRPLDSARLRFYTFRADGPMMEKYAKVMLAGRPDDVAALRTLARGQLLEGDIDGACATYRRILELDPDNFDALVALGTILQSSDTAASEALLRRAAQIKESPYLERRLE